MEGSLKQTEEALRFTQSLTVEVSLAEFVLFEAVRHLDLRALSRVEYAEVELGYFATECRPLVHAIITKGMVTNIRVEPCPESGQQSPSDEMLKLLRAARRRVMGRRKQRELQPTPVERFMQNIQKAISVNVITCVRICILGYCFVCCTTVRDEIWCGDRVIIHTP